MAFQHLCEIGDVQRTGCHRQHHRLGFVDLELQVTAVQQAEDAGRRPGKPLVPVDKRVIPGQRVQQRRNLLGKARIRLGAEDGACWASSRRSEETRVAHLDTLENPRCGR